MPGPDTPFIPLWIDQPDAEAVLEQKITAGEVSDTLGERLGHLIRYGYVIIPGAIAPALANALIKKMYGVTSSPKHFIARRGRESYAHPTEEVVEDPSFRIIDFHVNCRLASKAIYCNAITEVLQAVFASDANAFQCLTFVHGSQQAMHQDGAYVVVSEPLQFLASWIALEDVTEGSGELEYYAGSHRLDDFLFGDTQSKSWNPGIDGTDIHKEFLASIIQRSQAEGMTHERFLPKKGDALIWASDLVHGGAKMQNDDTRRSIVTHYCPVDVKPRFSTFTDFFHLRQVAPTGYISSRHYDLREKKRWFSRKPGLLKPKFMGGKTLRQKWGY